MIARWSRVALPVVAWLYVAGLLVQVLLAGLGMFADRGAFATHVALGWILHIVPVLIVTLVALARLGRGLLWHSLALFVVQFIQPILATFRGSAPVVAAFHPPLALVVFALAVTLAIRVTHLPPRDEPLTAA
ncbi:MAG: DUF6220 domain-containing protein [Candidatus Limnocylindria bacterium]